MTFTVTKEWLLDNTTDKDSWNALQFHCLAMEWPPVKGWKKRVIGMQISTDKKCEFEQASKIRPKSTIRTLEARILKLELMMAKLTVSN